MNYLSKHSSLALAILPILFILLPAFSYAQQPRLQITSPSDGTIVTEGTTLSITVSADPSVEIIGVLTDGRFPDLRAGSSPNQFLQVIPTTLTPGIYHLTAIGVTSKSDVESDPVAIDVEPRLFPIAIAAKSPLLAFGEIGNRLSIQVTGTFTDGSELDLTHSTQTIYKSNDPHVATVNSAGIVTAMGPGETSILLKAGSTSSPVYGAVLIHVAQPPPSGVPLLITSVTPVSGIPGKTQVTIKGSGFGATREGGVLLLGTRNATEIASWGDNQIIATVPAGSRNGVVEAGRNGLYSNDVAFRMNVPIVESISPADLSPGMRVILTGTGFGAVQGANGRVVLNNQFAPIVSWSDTRVVAIVPSGTLPGMAHVEQGGVTSDGVYFAIAH